MQGMPLEPESKPAHSPLLTLRCAALYCAALQCRIRDHSCILGMSVSSLLSVLLLFCVESKASGKSILEKVRRKPYAPCPMVRGSSVLGVPGPLTVLDQVGLACSL
jgi:hypothetical protein